MKLVTFDSEHGTRLGAFVARNGTEVVVDLNQANPELPADMLSFIQVDDAGMEAARRALVDPPASATLELEEVHLRAPIPRPGKIIGIGLNYSDHAAESGLEVPDYPTVFAKYLNAVIGPGEPIVLPRISDQVDYEAELAFAIGRTAKYVAEVDAMEYVAGYLAFNDVSARDFQMRTTQWTVGKTFDTFAPMGPALVTRDEIGDPHQLDIRLTIEDEVLQDSNTSNLIFSIPSLVSHLSQVMTLEPGDVITTGTPPGVGFARKPPRFLRPGDVVRVEIEDIGVLENPVVAEEAGR